MLQFSIPDCRPGTIKAVILVETCFNFPSQTAAQELTKPWLWLGCTSMFHSRLPPRRHQNHDYRRDVLQISMPDCRPGALQTVIIVGMCFNFPYLPYTQPPGLVGARGLISLKLLRFFGTKTPQIVTGSRFQRFGCRLAWNLHTINSSNRFLMQLKLVWMISKCV